MKTRAELAIEEGVAKILFVPDKEGKPPTIDYELLDELENHLQELSARENQLIAAFFESTSLRYFIVGANLEVLKTLDGESIAAWVRRGNEVFDFLEKLPLPTVAVVRGYALGGGLELALACDYILATETSYFGNPEVKIGLIPGWGGCTRLPERVGWSVAKELQFTGKVIDAKRAYNIGLINFVGSDEQLDVYLTEMIEWLREGSSISIQGIKKLINDAMVARRMADATSREVTASKECFARGEATQRLEAFFKKRGERRSS